MRRAQALESATRPALPSSRLAQLAASSACNKTESAVLAQLFYERLRGLRDQHRKYPVAAEAPALSALPDLPDNWATTTFSGEEALGRYAVHSVLCGHAQLRAKCRRNGHTDRCSNGWRDRTLPATFRHCISWHSGCAINRMRPAGPLYGTFERACHPLHCTAFAQHTTAATVSTTVDPPRPLSPPLDWTRHSTRCGVAANRLGWLFDDHSASHSATCCHGGLPVSA
jgi:hypothetical protein